MEKTTTTAVCNKNLADKTPTATNGTNSIFSCLFLASMLANFVFGIFFWDKTKFNARQLLLHRNTSTPWGVTRFYFFLFFCKQYIIYPNCVKF